MKREALSSSPSGESPTGISVSPVASGSTLEAQDLRRDVGDEAKQPAKTVACNACRGLKMKCKRSVDTEGQPCDRCARVGRECIVPPYRKPGRVRGAKNKYKGVDRALRQIQSELKRAKRGSQPTTTEVLDLIMQSEGTTEEKEMLSSLLNTQSKKPDIMAQHSSSTPEVSTSESSQHQAFSHIYTLDHTGGATLALENSQADINHLLLSAFDHSRPILDPPSSAVSSLPFSFAGVLHSTSSPPPATPSSAGTHESGPHTSHAISNPLGLLAEASEGLLGHSFPAQGVQNSLSESTLPNKVTDMLGAGPLDSRLKSLDLSWSSVSRGLLSVCGTSNAEKHKGLDFFRSNSEAIRGDLGDEFDPVTLGLLTEHEVTEAFSIFFEQLHPLISVLDPSLHTPEFVRSRSAFLFTVICYTGIQFEAEKGELSKRLRMHADRLAKVVVARRYRSLEIGQAFLVRLPWMEPGRRQADDSTWFYTSYALTISVELGLDRTFSASWSPEKLRSVLAGDLEGFEILTDSVVDRMRRNRERVATSAAISFGRSSSIVAENELIRNEEWHIHPLAEEHDQVTTAMVRLRRHILLLSKEIQHRLETNTNEGTAWIRPLVDSTLDPWRQRWPVTGGLPTEAGTKLPSLYVDLFFCHARLWCLSLGLKNCTRPSLLEGDERSEPPAVVGDCLVAALSACKTAVEGLQSSRFYWKMPNTVFPLLSWAACLSMRLFDCNVGFEGFIASQATLLGLLGNLAICLEEVGQNPPHRFGTAAIYGRHLHAIVRARISAVWKLYLESNESGGAATPALFLPGTVTPYETEGGSFPLASWPSEWWLHDTALNWAGEQSSNMLGLLDEVERDDYGDMLL